MSDFYTEQLIKKQTTGKDRMIKILLILLTVVSVLIIFIFPFGIILPVALIALDVFMFQRMDVEYEYLFVNGDLDIDKIMHKARRKRECVPSISMMWRFCTGGFGRCETVSESEDAGLHICIRKQERICPCSKLRRVC